MDEYIDNDLRRVAQGEGENVTYSHPPTKRFWHGSLRNYSVLPVPLSASIAFVDGDWDRSCLSYCLE